MMSWWVHRVVQKPISIWGVPSSQGATLLYADAYANIQGVGFGGIDVANVGDTNGDNLPRGRNRRIFCIQFRCCLGRCVQWF